LCEDLVGGGGRGYLYCRGIVMINVKWRSLDLFLLSHMQELAMLHPESSEKVSFRFKLFSFIKP
jgi:hypothetical protein